MMKKRFLVLSLAAVASVAAALIPQPGSSKDCYKSYGDVCVNSRGQSLSVPSGTTGKALCIVLGEWKGKNPVIIEWEDRYAARNIRGVKGRSNAVAIRVKQRPDPGQVVVYSEKGYVQRHEWRACSTKMARNIQNLSWKKQ